MVSKKNYKLYYKKINLKVMNIFWHHLKLWSQDKTQKSNVEFYILKKSYLFEND